jgi:hypothetical protein
MLLGNVGTLRQQQLHTCAQVQPSDLNSIEEFEYPQYQRILLRLRHNQSYRYPYHRNLSFSQKNRLIVGVSRREAKWGHNSFIDYSHLPIQPSTETTPLQSGNFEQPQNFWPERGPFLATRSTISLPHLGHARATSC